MRLKNTPAFISNFSFQITNNNTIIIFYLCKKLVAVIQLNSPPSHWCWHGLHRIVEIRFSIRLIMLVTHQQYTAVFFAPLSQNC